VLFLSEARWGSIFCRALAGSLDTPQNGEAWSEGAENFKSPRRFFFVVSRLGNETRPKNRHYLVFIRITKAKSGQRLKNPL
jgi:hypothetical protein